MYYRTFRQILHNGKWQPNINPCSLKVDPNQSQVLLAMKSRRRLLRRDFWSCRLRGILAAALCGEDFVAGEDRSERVRLTQEAGRLAVNTDSRAAGRPQIIKKKMKNIKIIKTTLKTLKIMLLTKDEKKIVTQSRDVARWFQIKIEIRVFGKLIWSYVWPPEHSKTTGND